MSRTLSNALRQTVIARARNCCEYCLYPQAASFFAFEMEHIISEKHGGATSSDNLALACPFCNRFKGTDLGSVDKVTQKLTPFFNPRVQKWNEHFALEGALIQALSAEGRVTIAILRMNDPERIAERARLLEANLFFD